MSAPRRVLPLLLGAVVASVLVALGTSTAAVADDCPRVVIDPDGTTHLENCVTIPGGGDGGDGGGGGGGNAPACEFTGIWDEFCRGTAPCYKFDPANLQNDDYVRESLGQDLAEKPSDSDHLIYVSCLPPGGERQDLYYWASEFEGETVSIRDRLLSAYAQLPLPAITPVFNPPTRTLVNLDTWWWAQGAQTTEARSPEALGLVAIAAPDKMTVTAGAQTVTCPIVATRSDECVMVFRRAGDYDATVTVSYAVRFEIGGQPFTVPGGNEDVLTASRSAQVQVPVREVQTLVERTR